MNSRDEYKPTILESIFEFIVLLILWVPAPILIGATIFALQYFFPLPLETVFQFLKGAF